MTPIVTVTLGLVAGLLPALRWPPGLAVLAVALAAAGALLTLLLSRPERAGPRATLLAFALLGAALGGHAARAAVNDCRRQIPDGVVLSGVAVIDGPGVAGGSVVLRLESLALRGRPVACRGAVRARLPRRLPALDDAAHVRFTGSWWAWPGRSRWPASGAHAGMLSIRRLEPAAAAHGHPLLAARARAWARVTSLFTREQALAEALVLARRENIEAGVRDDFAASGLAHLLAISGSHVGVLAGVVLLLAKLARLRGRRAAILATAASGAYVLFLGAPAAAARAGLQGVALLASRVAQRPADPLALLGAAALLLIAIDPLVVLDIGFQLSFAGVFGLVAFRRAAGKLIPAGLPSAVASNLAATLAATFTTTPIVAWHFGLVSLISPLANLIAAPLLGLIVPALVAALGAAALFEPLGRFLAGGTEVLLRVLRGAAHAAASVPGGHAWVSAEGVIAALLATLAFLVFVPLRTGSRDRSEPEDRRRRARTALALRAALAAAVLLLWPVLRPGGSGVVEVHAIDVGQGDAFAIRSPRGRWLLVDTGPRSGRYDAGRSVVVPYLLAHGVTRVEAIILSHPHADHIGGVRSVWERLDAGPVIDPAAAAGEGPYLEVVAAARAAGRTWLAGRAGRELEVDGMTLQILAPTDSAAGAVRDPNDLSVVVRLEYGRFSALFLGDASRAVESRIVARHGEGLEAEVLKVGHHGSRTSTGDSLLDAVRPRVALVSVGRRNRYGHPNPDVLDRLRRHGVRVLRTDESGSIIVRGRASGAIEVRAVR